MPASPGMTDDSRLVQQVYARALLRDPEEWEDFLDRECAGQPQLRARVAELLKAHAPDFLATPVPSPPPPAPEAFVERRVGSYILRREIGRGGMGVVYLADDTRLGRTVAIKALSPTISHSPDLRVRLLNEAKVAAGLSHPGIATVYALEEIEGELYLAVEFIAGVPLRALVQAGPLPLSEVVDIGLQLAEALAEAHTKGIVHRDIKPENVMKTPSGRIKVLDFGLAKAEYAQVGVTAEGFVVGTPAYLSPEQAAGGPVDHRSDIFTFGVLLYELASGKNPFVSASVLTTLARIREYDPPPLAQSVGRSHAELDPVLRRCLQKEPGARYQSTREIVADLEQIRANVTDRRSDTFDVDPGPEPSANRRRWLIAHQAVVAAVYVSMLFPAWYARTWLPSPWGISFVLGVLACVAAGTSLRLHLLFTAAAFPRHLPRQLDSSRLWIRLAEVVFIALLIAAGLAISGTHAEFAMLFVGVAVAKLVASFVIEPATIRAALSDDACYRMPE